MPAQTGSYTTSQREFWRKGGGGGMVPYDHPDATAQIWGDPDPPPGGGGSTPPGAAPPPAPGSGPTTPPGTPQRPTEMPPSPPPSSAPAPQIPLGPTTRPYDVATGQPAGTTGNVTTTHSGQRRATAPGLIDASRQTVPTTPAGQDPADAAFRTALLELLSQDPNDVSLTDADIAPQQRAFQGAAERAALQQRAELMERASAEGIADTEATRAAGRAIQERTGQAIGANDATLLTQKMQARRDQLDQAMQIANARGMQQEANDLARQIANLDAQLKTNEQGITREGMQLQRDIATLDTNTKQYLADLDAQLRREGYSTQERLAQLDAEVRRYGIDTQGNIGQLELALRRELGIGELNLGLLQTLLQNSQFNNRLGFDIGAFQSGLNRDALLAAL